MEISERFFKYVKKTDGCWLWIGSKTGTGYGNLKIKKKVVCAHRYSWEYHNSACIKPGIHVLHKCDIPACVNPDHLFLGTHLDNMRDMLSKKRENYLGNAKLSKQDIEKIKVLYGNGGISQEALGKQFGVCGAHISRIVRGVQWYHDH